MIINWEVWHAFCMKSKMDARKESHGKGGELTEERNTEEDHLRKEGESD